MCLSITDVVVGVYSHMRNQKLTKHEGGGGGGGGGGGRARKTVRTPSSNIVQLKERIMNLLS